ncbi:MAG: hypothetical protein ACUVQM_04360 [Candidatus Hadarchaeaceae archaeon]
MKEAGIIKGAFSVYYIGFNENDENYVKILHRNGLKVASNLPYGKATATENLQHRDKAWRKDILQKSDLLP